MEQFPSSFDSKNLTTPQNTKGSDNSKDLLNGNNSLIAKTAGRLNKNEDHREGKTTKAIEHQTSKIPSGFYLTLAIGSMALSAALAASSKRKEMANFVGLWAPSFLLLGIYNKIVKNQADQQSPV